MSQDLKHRLGKIKVDEKDVWDLRLMTAILAECIVLNVDRLEYSRMWVYTVVCPRFDRLVDGEMVPEYRAWLSKNSLGYVTVEKLEKVT